MTFYAKAAETWPTTATDRWLQTYGPELDNLRAAVEWALAPGGGDAGLGLDLIGHSMRLRFELACSLS